MSQFDLQSLGILSSALKRLDEGFSDLPPISANPVDDIELERTLQQVAERLQDNYPYFHPLYAGQMLKPPHPIARLAYTLALWLNPNNHALDGGRASSGMEKEAISEIAQVFGWTTALGNLCSGGTMANLEALWIAGQLTAGAKIVASQQAHYTHRRISGVLGLRYASVPCDSRGRMCVESLEQLLSAGDVGTVVATLGSTATGSVDPLQKILQLRERYPFRLHADGAYGGYFCLLDDLAPETAEAFEVLSEVDSIVLDPHKHGLQPYGCGCVVFRDASVGSLYQHDSPYTYFTSEELHLGEISLECSRPGAAAVALWATQKLLPLVRGGTFAEALSRGREAASRFHQRLRGDERFLVPFEPELDIIVWAVRSATVTRASELARNIFEECARRQLHLALAECPCDFFDLNSCNMLRDRSTILCLRSVLMKPDHLDWLDRIWSLLIEATAVVLRAT